MHRPNLIWPSRRIGAQKNLFPPDFQSEVETKLRPMEDIYTKQANSLNIEEKSVRGMEIKARRAVTLKAIDEFTKSRPQGSFEAPAFSKLNAAMDVYGEILGRLGNGRPVLREHGYPDLRTRPLHPGLQYRGATGHTGAVSGQYRSPPGPESFRGGPQGPDRPEKPAQESFRGMQEIIGGVIEWQFPLRDKRRMNTEAGFPRPS